MAILNLDDNSVEILDKIKEQMKKEGFSGPSYSDCVRYIKNKLDGIIR